MAATVDGGGDDKKEEGVALGKFNYLHFWDMEINDLPLTVYDMWALICL